MTVRRLSRLATSGARNFGALRRLEVGSGGRPRSGYVHVDTDPFAPSLDLCCPGHRIPLPDEWASEILSIHAIEHVQPDLVAATIAEWFRLLEPGGLVEIHTPNASAIGSTLSSAGDSAATHWAIQSAIFGYGLGPGDAAEISRLRGRPDHRVLFTFATLAELLAQAGFSRVRTAPADKACIHMTAWQSIVPHFCLEIVANKSELFP